MKDQYQLNEDHLPPYHGTRQFVEIEGWDEEGSEGGEREKEGEETPHKSAPLTGLPTFDRSSFFTTPPPLDDETSSYNSGSGVLTPPATHPTTTTTSTGAQQHEFIVVWITAPNPTEATKLAEGLVEQNLAACVNLVPNIESIYKWEGKVERSGEVLMMAKTRGSLLAELSAFVLEHHSYEVPETIAAGIVGGGAGYLNWLRESTREPKEEGGEGGREGGSAV